MTSCLHMHYISCSRRRYSPNIRCMIMPYILMFLKHIYCRCISSSAKFKINACIEHPYICNLTYLNISNCYTHKIGEDSLFERRLYSLHGCFVLSWTLPLYYNNNNNNNNNNKLQLGCHPVAVVILQVYKIWNWILLNLSREGYMRSM